MEKGNKIGDITMYFAVSDPHGYYSVLKKSLKTKNLDFYEYFHIHS